MKNLALIYRKIEEKKGANWYFEANHFARNVAKSYQVDFKKVCAILSALSPGVNWEQNKKETVTLIRINQGLHTKKFNFSTYGHNVVKAQKIYDGDIDPDKAFSLKTSPKTYNFYHNIVHPESPDYVTIDRHAFRIATGEEYDRISPKQYRELAAHYKRAAKRLGILPNILQSVLWEWYREENVNKYKKYNLSLGGFVQEDAPF